MVYEILSGAVFLVTLKFMLLRILYLLVFYLTTLSVPQTMVSKDGMKYDLEKMCKEVVMA